MGDQRDNFKQILLDETILLICEIMPHFILFLIKCTLVEQEHPSNDYFKVEPDAFVEKGRKLGLPLLGAEEGRG